MLIISLCCDLSIVIHPISHFFSKLFASLVEPFIKFITIAKISLSSLVREQDRTESLSTFIEEMEINALAGTERAFESPLSAR